MTSEASAMVEVEVDAATAFEVFTSEAAAWWQRDRSLWGATGTVRFEPGVGGRLLLGDQSGVEVGRISVWEPGPRLVFSYGPPGTVESSRTEVEVRFEGTEFGTRVVLRHRGWTQEESGGEWARLLSSFAKHSLEQVLLHRLGEFLDAIGAGDLEFFERNLTDDALLIFPGPGNAYTKEQCLAVMGDHPPYLKYDIADQRVVHLGGSTAVLTHRATVLTAHDDAPRTVMVGSVLVNTDGAWRLALHQWTPVDD